MLAADRDQVTGSDLDLLSGLERAAELGDLLLQPDLAPDAVDRPDLGGRPGAKVRVIRDARCRRLL